MHKIDFFILIIAILTMCSTARTKNKNKPFHHFNNGFRNLEPRIENNYSFFSKLPFMLSRPFVLLKKIKVPEDHLMQYKIALADLKDLHEKDFITWIGHMTALIKMGRTIILTDPFFSKMAAPLPPFGAKRLVPPGIKIEDLPEINVIIITHSHYDHLDISSLKKIPNIEQITVVVPLKLSKYISDIGFKKIIELDWYEHTNINDMKILLLPSYHSSKRSIFSKNDTLWGSFSIEQKDKKVFFSCDSEYNPFYKSIGKEYGPFDYALLSVGAYKPRSVMQGNHCEPKGCLQIGIDIKAKKIIPMHWGTVLLSFEKFNDPYDKLLEEAKKLNLSEKIIKMKIGETIEIFN